MQHRNVVRIVELEFQGDDLAAIARAAPARRRPSSGSKPRRMAPPSSSLMRCRIGQRVAEQPLQAGIDRKRDTGGGRARPRATGRPARRRRCRRPQHPRRAAQPDRAASPRLSDSRASAQAMSSVAVRSAARKVAAPTALAPSQDAASWREGDRGGVGQRGGQPGRQHAGAGGGGEGAIDCGEQGVLRGPLAGAQDFEAGASGGVHRQGAGAALRCWPGQSRQGARLGGPHVVERQGGGDRLGIDEAAERIQAGGAVGLGQAAAGDQGRRRDGFPARGDRTSRRAAAWRRRGSRRVPGGRAGLGSSDAVRAAVSNRPVETSSRAAPIVVWSCARASSRLGRAASSSASSVSVPGVIRRTTARRIGALLVRVFGFSICSATATRKPRRIGSARDRLRRRARERRTSRSGAPACSPRGWSVRYRVRRRRPRRRRRTVRRNPPCGRTAAHPGGRL